ncbi:MAG: DUF2723 domain-containing protein [Chloroflexi bacterium]|nr:DUF2723 domain-containing protein [Chloroflexota bacterium]
MPPISDLINFTLPPPLLAVPAGSPNSRGRKMSVTCAVTVALVSLGFYLATLAPALTWAFDSADGGELAAAAQTLGIPHPPGYPTYVLLAHLFTYLPVGEVATRTNLFSAVCAAGTAAILTWTLARATRNWFAAIGAGLALAFSPLLWRQAVVTEVHTLNALFTALLLTFAVCVNSTPLGTPRGNRMLAMTLGVIWGLSLGNHLTALFCAPLVILALWRLGRSGLWGMGGLVLGLLVYLYLPLRAAAEPPINWGNPCTLARFWWMISGGPYHQFVFSLPQAHLVQRLLAWLNLPAQQFGWIGLPVMAFGIAALLAVDSPLLGATVATVALGSGFAIGYDTADSYLYLIPSVVCLGLWLGLGLDWLIEALRARVRWAWGAAVLAILLPLAMGILRVPTVDLSADQTAETFKTAILAPAHPQAVLLSQEDVSTFAIWYFQYGLRYRQDVVVIDLDLLGYEWYVAQLARQLRIAPPVEALRSGEIDKLKQVSKILERPVCWIVSDSTELSCVEP